VKRTNHRIFIRDIVLSRNFLKPFL